jgi:hypothetical protein
MEQGQVQQCKSRQSSPSYDQRLISVKMATDLTYVDVATPPHPHHMTSKPARIHETYPGIYSYSFPPGPEILHTSPKGMYVRSHLISSIHGIAYHITMNRPSFEETHSRQQTADWRSPEAVKRTLLILARGLQTEHAIREPDISLAPAVT